MTKIGFNTYPMQPFEEVIGVLHEMAEDNGALITKIGKLNVALPWELENELKSLIGCKIGILRTDIPGKTYLWKLIENKVMADGELNGSKVAMAA